MNVKTNEVEKVSGSFDVVDLVPGVVEPKEREVVEEHLEALGREEKSVLVRLMAEEMHGYAPAD